MSVTCCVCCAGSTPAPTILLTRVGIECPSSRLLARKAASAVSPPGQRVIARMLTGWGRSAVFKQLAWTNCHQFSRCVPGEVPAPAASIPQTGCRVPPRVELAVQGSSVPRCWKKLSSRSQDYLTMLARMQWYSGYCCSPCLFSLLRSSTCGLHTMPSGASQKCLFFWVLRFISGAPGTPPAPSYQPHRELAHSRFTGGMPTPVGVGTPQAALKMHAPHL